MSNKTCEYSENSFFLLHEEELLSLLEALCHIPAPSGHEEQRAAFIQRWLLEQCSLPSRMDDAKNVLVEFPGASGGDTSRTKKSISDGILLFTAHTDTVFPDTDPMPVVRTSERISSPGVGDDTACTAILMIFLKYKKRELSSCPHPLLFAFNSCEEGLGNLKGSRQIMHDYGSRIREMTSFDGGVRGICNRAVGSLRYRILIRTRGGHSYNNFGSPNAIEAQCSLISRLYQMRLPDQGRNTFNVGVIEGGTSVNTIAQSCSCLFEYRSDTRESLAAMDAWFHDTLKQFQAQRPGIALDLELIGERPCSGDVDPDYMRKLTGRALSSMRRFSDSDPLIGSGSTDCNIPLSLGIPAICFGGLLGDGVHTREEYVSIPLLLQMAKIIENYLTVSISAP